MIETVQDINKGIPGTSIISATEIAKLIRADIKAIGLTKKNGFKISVTTDKFSGGCAIDVRVAAMPFELYTQEYLELQEEYKNNWGDPSLKCKIYSLESENTRYNPKAKVIVETLEHIYKSYSYSDSDSQVDYFNTNYYGAVSFDI